MTENVAPKAPTKRAPRKPKAVTVPVEEVAPVVEEENPQLYIRNRGGVRVRIGAPRQKKGERYDYELAPRGERGDAEPIDDADLQYLMNSTENEGLYEIITFAEANSYMAKQVRNQQRFHPALAALKDEFGNQVHGIAHQRVSTSANIGSSVTVPDGDLNQLNEFPAGRPE